jgi:hypothetical protein
MQRLMSEPASEEKALGRGPPGFSFTAKIRRSPVQT